MGSSFRNDLEEASLPSPFQRLSIGTPGSLSFRVLFVSPQNSLLSPWHDIPLCSAGGFSCVCTTPAGSWLRFQVAQDEPSDPLRVDRVAGPVMTRSTSLRPATSSQGPPSPRSRDSSGPSRMKAMRVLSSGSVSDTDPHAPKTEEAASSTTGDVALRAAHFSEDTSWHLGFFPQTSCPVYQASQGSSRNTPHASSLNQNRAASNLGDSCLSAPNDTVENSNFVTAGMDKPTGGRRKNNVTFLDVGTQNNSEAPAVRMSASEARAITVATRKSAVVVPSDASLPNEGLPSRGSGAEHPATNHIRESSGGGHTERPGALKVRSKKNRPLEAMEIGCQKGRSPGEVYEVRPLAVFSRVRSGEQEREALAVVVVATDNPLAEVLDDGEDVEVVFPGMLKRMRDWLEKQQRVLGFEELRDGVSSSVILTDTSLHSTTGRVSKSHLVWQGQYELATLQTEPVVLPSLEENLLTALWDAYTHGSSSYLAHVAIPFSNPLKSSSSAFSISDAKDEISNSSTKHGKSGSNDAKYGSSKVTPPTVGLTKGYEGATSAPALPPRRARFTIGSSLFSWSQNKNSANSTKDPQARRESGRRRGSKTEASSPRDAVTPQQFKHSMVSFSESLVQQKGREGGGKSGGRKVKAAQKKAVPVDPSFVAFSESAAIDRNVWLPPVENGMGMGAMEGFQIGDATAQRTARLKFLDIA
eukprot:TRINITY_DN11585_c0_g1_i1.p1 TRINITY_DN11585_c0_g1~~TRINITY_DN11585_c0_g1_i1.p1  ORF type:complete len:698 (-),score=102.83 TRINITY_DN11585_c0_g1_i1:654-2747(-)